MKKLICYLHSYVVLFFFRGVDPIALPRVDQPLVCTEEQKAKNKIITKNRK